ncbi:hypothetical protein [Dactylosporangium sp. CA-092794]|uniref:hypothetical protein n=1 Tax=Dactylosporangium sp. CA-092794 TaxID=3239929 RepID=UPI003D948934
MTSESTQATPRTVVRMLVSSYDEDKGFDLSVEPEGMSYAFPPERQIVFLFRGPDAMDFEVSHAPSALIIWRPANTQVWAGPIGGPMQQIGGQRHNPFWMDDAGSESLRSWWPEKHW